MTIEKYSVTRDRLLVRVHTPEKRTASGFYLAVENSENPPQGQVVKCGDGRKNRRGDGRLPMSVTSGDKILFESGAGIPLKFDGLDLLLLEEDQVIGVLENWL